MPNLIYDDNYSTALPDGPQRIQLPFSICGDQTSAIVEQDFMQLYSAWTPLPANSLHPTIPLCYLIEETPLMPTQSGGVAKWTRKYATIPISRDEGSSMSYQFPGIQGAVFISGAWTVLEQRQPQSWSTSVRIRYDYFIVGTGFGYTTFRGVPVIQKQHYFIPLIEGQGFTYQQGMDVTTLVSQYLATPTSPTAEEYLAWVMSGTEIVAEDSTISRWMGNFFARQTKYVVAI